jgi:hypothetical protein
MMTFTFNRTSMELKLLTDAEEENGADPGGDCQSIDFV